ncbi:MAG: protein kinase domain-containing protein, partial [Gemmatimonadaceae bacterium]
MLGRLRAALSDRYAVEKELGRGATAIVFLARDRKHERPVAIKVLQPELGITRERFLREIRMAARLRHAHILPLHDSGDADGLLYYVMPYVEGESLAAHLKRERRLPLEETVRIAAEVADGLDYAHKHDVVHRDIKPGNILIEDGHATIADFGIARAIDKATEEHLTDTGLSIGTPAYMSPEQFAEPESVDARSDVYSLGCVVFEMIVGTPPFDAPSMLAAIAKRLGTGADFTLLETAAAGHVRPVMTKVLASDPGDRYATAGEFATALASAVTSPMSARITGAEPSQSARSIAVLPFTNMSADPEAEYFADGMSEEIINALTKLESLRVASRTSAFAFKGKDQDIRKIGQQLNVENVLEGSVRKAGSKLRITAQLISVSNGYHLWSDRFDRELTDVFAIQDEIACAIVAALQVKLGTAPPKLVKQYTQNIGAYNLYLKWRHFWNRRGEGLGRALQYFE